LRGGLGENMTYYQ